MPMENPPGEAERDEGVAERSRKDAVEESRSLDGILDCELVDGEKCVWCVGKVASVCALTRDTGDPFCFLVFLLGVT